MKRGEPYRDDSGVLRCHHGAKLHLICDECLLEESHTRNTADELVYAVKVLLCLVAALIGFMVGAYFGWSF